MRLPVSGHCERWNSSRVVSLVRMQAESALSDFRKYAIAERGDKMSRVSYWGVQQFSGEEPPPLPKKPVEYTDWFLSPL